MNEIKNVVNTNYTETQTALNDLSTGSGWQNITLASGVSVGSIGGTPQYRKIGNIVYVQGGFAYTKGSSSMTLGTLPDGYRPTDNIYVFSAMAGSRIVRTVIAPTGEIVCDWIYNLNGGTAYTGSVTWNAINISYVVAGA